MKALSLMLWFVSSENWLTFEKRLWRTRVDGPDRDQRTKHVTHEHPGESDTRLTKITALHCSHPAVWRPPLGSRAGIAAGR